MRPALLPWLRLLVVAAAAAAAAPDAPPTTAMPAPTAAAAAPSPAAAAEATLAPPVPSSLLFPSSSSSSSSTVVGGDVGGHQMRASSDGVVGSQAMPAQPPLLLHRPDIAHATPWLASLARAFPTSLRALDGRQQPAQSREAVSAIEEFTGPLVRFATGGQPVAADVEQLIDSIPHLARSANALKEADKVNLSSLDITSLPSNVVAHVLGGGPIPGIDQTELDRVVREHLKRMSETADRLLRGEKVENVEKILLPLEKVPVEMVMTSLQGKTLPGLTDAETAKIREYYTKQLPSLAPKDTTSSAPLPETLTALGGMVQLLPPGYDIGRIPPEFIQSIMAGRVPDLALLPPDLQAYFGAGKDEAMMFVRSLNSSVTEIVQQLAAAVQKLPEMARAEAYDLSQVKSDVIDLEAHRDKQTRSVLYTIAWVAAACGVALVAVLWLLYRKYASPSRKAPRSLATPPARVLVEVDGAEASRVARARLIADAAVTSARRRNLASPPEGHAKVEFSSRACRFSTPKHPLVLDSPETKKRDDDVIVDEKIVAVEKEKTPSVDDSEDIYDTTTV